MSEIVIDENIIATPSRGKGIKFGNRSITSKSSNQNWGWRDITGQVTVRGVGAADPDWAQIGTSPFYAYKFAVNDQCWFVYHVPHDIVPNPQGGYTPIFFHTHWISDGTQTASVRWEYTYTYQKGFSQGAFDVTGTSVYSEESAAGVAYTHHVTETDACNVDGLEEPDGLIVCRIKRVVNTDSPAGENTDDIFLLTADIHYQSTNLATVNKSPYFYLGG